MDKQTIFIRGSGFGVQAPFNGYSRFLRLTDLAQENWIAGWAPDNNPLNAQAPIYVTEWTDNEIAIEGFPRYGGKWVFAVGDVVKIEVADPEGAGLPYPNDPNASTALIGVFSVRVIDANADTNLSINVQPPAPQQNERPDTITIPADTSILVRMIDSVDSSKNKVGDSFHASLETALVVGNTLVAPKGVDVYGKLAQAKSAGKISGRAELTLEMTGIRINGNIVPVESTDYDVAGKGRGKQSAGRIGGGAALGAIIGGIVGGGKGAGIGAAAGAGAGTAVQVMTHGEQIRIPSETLLEFRLQQGITAPVPGPAAGGQKSSQATPLSVGLLEPNGRWI